MLIFFFFYFSFLVSTGWKWNFFCVSLNLSVSFRGSCHTMGCCPRHKYLSPFYFLDLEWNLTVKSVRWGLCRVTVNILPLLLTARACGTSPLPGGRWSECGSPYKAPGGGATAGASPWKNTSAVPAPGGRKAWLEKMSFTLLLTPEPGTTPAAANPARFWVKDFAGSELLFLNEGYWSSFWP